MSVLSANIFDMLQDDADSGSVDSSVKKVEKVEKAKPVPVKKAPAPKKEVPAKDNSKRGDGSSRGGRGGARPGGDRGAHQNNDGERRERRAPRSDKTSGAGAGANRDRHSRGPKGSGVRGEKKEGHGRHNWGDKVEAEAAAAAANSEEAAEPAEPAAPVEPTAEELAAKAEREAEEKQMTLADYQKQQAEKKVGTELSVRQAGEGVDNSEWKDTVALSKKDDDAASVAPGQKRKSKKGNKKTVESASIDIKYNDDNARKESQGGRGGFGGKGRGGRGGNRGGRGAGANAPSLADESAFPSLG